MFLYFLTDTNHRTRISVSGDPHRRAKESGHSLVYTFNVLTKDIADLYKQRLISTLWSVKDPNDWFNVRPSEALRVLHQIRDQDPFNRLPIKKTWVNPGYLSQQLRRTV